MTDKKSCFVISPIGEPGSPERYKADNVLNYIIIPAAVGYEVVRAEKITDPGLISRQIIEKIQYDDLVIADLTDGNPNVFYELGIAHTLGKPVIMITQSMDYVPFDLKHLRCIVYDYKPAAIDRFENSLEKTIRRVLSSTFPAPSTMLRRE